MATTYSIKKAFSISRGVTVE